MSSQDYGYGLLDYLQASAWYLLIFIYIYYWGWLFGIVAYGVSYNVFALLLKATMDLEMMNGGDEVFFLDDHRNCSNIVSYQKYSRFDSKKMSTAMT